MGKKKLIKFPFQIIPEEASFEDAFSNGAHQRIAETILDSFENNHKGFTLGLEGRYGSGKSTVIRLLKQIISQKEVDKTYLFFYFDAWAHEGDPLRRVFLEELINQCLEKDNSKLRKLKNKIAGKTFKRKTKIKRGSTAFGFFMAITTLFIPIGLAIFSIIDKSLLTLNYTGIFNIKAIVASFLIASPAVTLLVNLFVLIFKKILGSKDKIFTLQKWALFQSKGNEKITENIKKSDERTSIEFEKYFHKIIRYLNLNPSRKLIVVLDNIDRTLPHDTKKLISTLQNFLTESSGLTVKEDEFNYIYTIIPYDLDGLKFKMQSEGNEFEVIKAFMDKNIRLKLKVPDLIITDWRSSFKRFIKQSLDKWGDEVNDVIEVLLELYPHATFSPTPRELKIYINQVGVLRNHFSEKEVSTRVLCYYVIKKFLPRNFNLNDELNEFSDAKIVSGIIEKNIPSKSDRLIINEVNFEDQLLTIVYDLKNSKDAYLIYIETPITEVLAKQNNSTAILDLEDLYKDNFWTIVRQILNKTENQIDLFKYIHSLGSVFESDKISFLQNSCNSIIRNLNHETLRHYTDKSRFLEDTLAFLIEYSSNIDFNKFLNDCINVLVVKLINEKGEDHLLNSNYRIINNLFSNQKISAKLGNYLPGYLGEEFRWELYSRIVFENDYAHPLLLLKEESIEINAVLNNLR